VDFRPPRTGDRWQFFSLITHAARYVEKKLLIYNNLQALPLVRKLHLPTAIWKS